MGQHTHIQWADHTFNPWWGCTRVAEGCRHCYAESLDKWLHKGAHWGVGRPRMVMSNSYWSQPLRWNQAAEKAGERRRVFCGSMCDVMDPAAPYSEVRALWDVIEQTPNLDWLLLSKRPDRYRPTFERYGCPRNVWAGASASTQRECDEACRHLQYLPSTLEFLSLEPLIEKVIIPPLSLSRPGDRDEGIADRIDWVIVGGESGPGARACDTDWIEQIVDQCAGCGIPVFVKQLGKRAICHGFELTLMDPKGGDPDEWLPGWHDLRHVPDPGQVWP